MAVSYYRPTSILQALQLKRELGQTSVFLAGGTEVNVELAPRPDALIDLAALGLDTIERVKGGLKIGAMVTFQQLLEHPEVPCFVKNAAALMVNRNIRNIASVGGQIASNKSCADLIPTLITAEATVQIALMTEQMHGQLAPTIQSINLSSFLKNPAQLIVSTTVPETNRFFGIANYCRSATDLSVVGAAVSVNIIHEKLAAPMIAVGGVAPHVIVLPAVANALNAKHVTHVGDIASFVSEAVSPISDLRGSAQFKRYLAGVLVDRAMQTALDSFFRANKEQN